MCECHEYRLDVIRFVVVFCACLEQRHLKTIGKALRLVCSYLYTLLQVTFITCEQTGSTY